MPYLPEIGRSAPEIRCRWCQRRNHPPAPQPYEEKRISPQPVRRRRKTLTALFVWCRGTACFATFFTPEKGSGRSRLHKEALILAARPNHAQICENMSADNRQHPISRYRAATSFCQQTKGRKSCFPPLCSRGKRNDLPIISTPRFKSNK